MNGVVPLPHRIRHNPRRRRRQSMWSGDLRAEVRRLLTLCRERSGRIGPPRSVLHHLATPISMKANITLGTRPHTFHVNTGGASTVVTQKFPHFVVSEYLGWRRFSRHQQQEVTELLEVDGVRVR